MHKEVISRNNNQGGNDLACFSWTGPVFTKNALDETTTEQFYSIMDGHAKNVIRLMGFNVVTGKYGKRFEYDIGEEIAVPVSELGIVTIDKLKTVCNNDEFDKKTLEKIIDSIWFEGAYRYVKNGGIINT